MAFSGRDRSKSAGKTEEFVPLTSDQDGSYLELVASGGSLVPEASLPEPLFRDESATREAGLSVEPTLSRDSLGYSRDDSTTRVSSIHDEVNKIFDTDWRLEVDTHTMDPNAKAPGLNLMGKESSKLALSEFYHVDEVEYSRHRRYSYPHIHQPLRSLSNKSLNKSGKIHKKKKAKKKKEKASSYPSQGVVKSPPIVEVEEEHPTRAVELYENSGSSTDSDDNIDEEFEGDEHEESPQLLETSGGMTISCSAIPVMNIVPSTPSPNITPSTVTPTSPLKSPSPVKSPLFGDNSQLLKGHSQVGWTHMSPSIPDYGRHVSSHQEDDNLPDSAMLINSSEDEDCMSDSGFPVVQGRSLPSKLVRSVSDQSESVEEGVPSQRPTHLTLEGSDDKGIPSPGVFIVTPWKQSLGGKVTFVVGDDTSYPNYTNMQSGFADTGYSEEQGGESQESAKENMGRRKKKRGAESRRRGSSDGDTQEAGHTLAKVESIEESQSTRSGRRRHHHHHHEHFRTEDLIMRRQKGSEVVLGETFKRFPTESEEASTLYKADLDEMTSHRFEDQRGIRRHKIARNKGALHSVVHIGKSHHERKPKLAKKYDHSPHEVFVELDELHFGGDEMMEWREKARWIKFEEDVEEGAERWGKPHVASLSFHSLLELRRGLEQGTLLLDLEASDLTSIIHSVVENMVIRDLVEEEVKGKLLRTLLLKHKHQQHEKGLLSSISQSSFGSSLGLNKSPSQLSIADKKRKDSKAAAKLEMVKVDVDNNMPTYTEENDLNGGISSNWTSADVRAQVRWAGHVVRMPDKRIPKQLMYCELCKGKRPVGGQKKRFKDSLKTDKHSDGVHIGITPADQKKHVLDIMRRIPKGSEATTVLVGQVNFLKKPAMAFVRLAEGRMLENLTEVPLPVRFLFVLLGPEKGGMDYHEVGRSLSTLMSNQQFHDVAYRAESREDLLRAINNFLDDSIVLPPGDWDHRTLLPITHMARKRALMRKQKKQQFEEKEALHTNADKDDIPLDPLQRTGCLFGGVINDVRRRFPYYLSDIKDAANAQSIKTVLFIFFTCLSPCIAFGGLLSEKTHSLMGVSETMVATSVFGMVFSLLSGQPLMIIGATGPVLVFEESLYKFCASNGLEFLPLRFWIGLWVCLITILAVALEGSFLVHYVTRFTEEIFAILISLIFIYEVVKKLMQIFSEHPLMESYCFLDAQGNISNNFSFPNGSDWSYHLVGNGQYDPADNLTERDVHPSKHAGNNGHQEYLNQPNTALLSLILIFGTFLIAYFLRVFRNSKFLGRSVRRALGDFGVLISLLCMVVLNLIMNKTYVQKLDITDPLTPTSSTRGWFINPMGMYQTTPIWLAFAAALPGFLIFILLFMETQITEMILNKKERKLKKGSGYHLDQLILGFMTMFGGLFGLPWMCAATVRTVAHISALSEYSRTHAPGEKPELLGVKEQRVTNFAVHLLIGISVTAGPLLRAVPVPALFGIFLYLGVSTLSGVQMCQRIKLLLMPVKYHPSVCFVRKVRTMQMHKFTLIQLACLLILIVIKSTAASLAFPFMLILLIPLRLKIMPRFFDDNDLGQLDKEEEDFELDEEDDPDFYQQAHMPI